MYLIYELRAYKEKESLPKVLHLLVLVLLNNMLTLLFVFFNLIEPY